MGFKEKMMESMMGNMSKEERSAMMDNMMDQFFGNMSTEEKQDMMKNMMPKMMGGGSMMEMMRSCCGGDESEGFNPMDMCRKMMTSINHSSELATYATPEIRGLFEEWIAQLDNEVLEFVKKNKLINPEDVAEYLKISKDSAVYLLSRLAQKGTITFSVQHKETI